MYIMYTELSMVHYQENHPVTLVPVHPHSLSIELGHHVMTQATINRVLFVDEIAGVIWQ